MAKRFWNRLLNFFDPFLYHKVRWDIRQDFDRYTHEREYHRGRKTGCEQCRANLKKFDSPYIKRVRVSMGLSLLGCILLLLWIVKGPVFIALAVWLYNLM